MATVYQASAGVTNANKITISMWCRAHTTNAPSDGGDYFQLLEFGSADETFRSIVGLLTNSTGATDLGFSGNCIQCAFSGAVDSIDGIDVCTLIGSSNPVGYSTLYRPKMPPENFGSGGGTTTYNKVTNFGEGGKKYTPSLVGTTKSISSLIDPGKWFHLMIAADATNTVSLGGAVNKLSILVNGRAQDLYGPTGSNEAYGLWTNGDMQQMLFDGVFYTPEVGFGPSRWAVNFGGDAWCVIPGFEFAMNGLEIGIPYQRASTSKNTQLLDMADVQIWVGQYIDPTDPTNFEKFINTVGGRKYSVSPYAAAIAFGPQTYLFTGAASSFITNRGTGGSFVKTGTLSDVAGPSI
jgi:hypothetical protein